MMVRGLVALLPALLVSSAAFVKEPRNVKKINSKFLRGRGNSILKNQCASNQFTCSYGYCIPGEYFCDGWNDCGDWSDEQDCPPCADDQFTCKSGGCIPGNWRCDNNWIDCSDGSDEANCGCRADQFTCNSGECIPGNWRCDNYIDCQDSSDEADCDVASTAPPAPPTTKPPAPPATAPPAPPQTTECGKKTLRIVGGQATDENEYPWQVGLSWPGSSEIWCGGSLVSSQWVITAAHCIQNPTDKLDLHFGAHYLHTAENDQKRLTRESVLVKVHPDYDDNTVDFDIAVIKIDKIEFNDAIRPVCLPQASRDYTGETVTVTGWGTLSTDGPQPNELQEVDVIVTTRQRCKDAYAPENEEITENMICAEAPGKDSCQGDSGGPLVYDRDDTYELAGVVSWGFDCADPKYPGVYTDVANANILKWLNGAMQ